MFDLSIKENNNNNKTALKEIRFSLLREQSHFKKRYFVYNKIINYITADLK